MRQIPVDTTSAAVMVAQPAQPKLKDRRTGERAMDAETGAALMTVDVMFAMDGNAEVLSVTVPETGISGELVMGTPVAHDRSDRSAVGERVQRPEAARHRLPRRGGHLSRRTLQAKAA